MEERMIATARTTSTFIKKIIFSMYFILQFKTGLHLKMDNGFGQKLKYN